VQATEVELKLIACQIHAFLDASKSSLETVKWRTKYYSYLLKAVFVSLGVPVDKLEFVTGSSYQLTAEYALDVFKYAFLPLSAARGMLKTGSTLSLPSKLPSTQARMSSSSRRAR
jgi:tyrosyl-tRNA synthetase